MKDPKETKPEEPHPDKYVRFIQLLTGIVAVPKAAIYELEPRLRPKPRPITGETKNPKQ
jgi:hypothetical protein